MPVRLAVEEPDLFPVRQERERDAELLGVVASLILRLKGVDAGALGLDRRHGPPRAVAERVVGPRAVRQRVLEQDAHAVREIPAGVLEKSVDLDAREGFGCSTHAPDHASDGLTGGTSHGSSGIPCRPVRHREEPAEQSEDGDDSTHDRADLQEHRMVEVCAE